MLSVNSYDKKYVNDCRVKVNALLSTYRDVLSAKPLAAIKAFEPHVFNHMVPALNDYFCHRARAMEGKDGNALNEVRILANSVASADGTFQLDKTIKYDPAKSILSYKIGDKVSLSADEFTRLSQAFFVEIEPKYP
jgi:hypothetical protein